MFGWVEWKLDWMWNQSKVGIETRVGRSYLYPLANLGKYIGSRGGLSSEDWSDDSVDKRVVGNERSCQSPVSAVHFISFHFALVVGLVVSNRSIQKPCTRSDKEGSHLLSLCSRKAPPESSPIGRSVVQVLPTRRKTGGGSPQCDSSRSLHDPKVIFNPAQLCQDIGRRESRTCSPKTSSLPSSVAEMKAQSRR
ncbi:hypothetical protein BCR44DRAFT_1319140 [Catenaria anguillulae PL171]|uniref:Uncharacterized protein n=1 Tax=Catenaria anguillulae PL171 TaxID=765915 RepID=A0A1Y2HU92_9FUNG|nr:hypothetical protein BCR44DRAFT_1319140 [Catenaria anguillulae PL171]